MDERLIVRVRLLRREGREIPRWQHAFGDGVRGLLSIQEERIEVLNRHARVATLAPARDGDEATKAIRPLVDVQIIAMTPEHFVLSGMERISDGLATTAYVQSWWVFPDSVEAPSWIPGDGVPPGGK